MSQKLYRKESSGAVCAVGTQTRYVTLPSSTIDLWMPLIGAVGVGVYALYCRLAREGRVCGYSKRAAHAPMKPAATSHNGAIGRLVASKRG